MNIVDFCQEITALKNEQEVSKFTPKKELQIKGIRIIFFIKIINLKKIFMAS